MRDKVAPYLGILAFLVLTVCATDGTSSGSMGEEASEALHPVTRLADVGPLVTEGVSSSLLSEGSKARGDSILGFDCQSPPDDNQCIGIEFDGHYFYVTGGGGTNHPDPNKLHFFDRDGNYIGSVDQPTTSYWGWKDIAYDGNHMYSSDGRAVDEWYVTGLPDNPVLHVVGSFPGPEDPNCAMAYDPATGHFWTAYYWGSHIYEFDRSGAVINQYPSIYSIYGMAWDTICPDGPWLWVSAQAAPSMVHQFDPCSGSYTGVSFPASGTAGGCAFSEDWHPEYCILFYMAQSYPDHVIAYEMCLKPSAWGLVTGGGWIPVVSDGSRDRATFGFNVHSESRSVWGQLQFNDHGMRLKVHSDTIETLTTDAGDTVANFSGKCRVSPVGSRVGRHSFECGVMDRGEPGRGVDSFSMDIYDEDGNLYYSAGGVLGGGNIQIHQPSDGYVKGGREPSAKPDGHPDPPQVRDALLVGQTPVYSSPNPFTDKTTISFDLPSSSHAILEIYDITGRLVATLVDRQLSPGLHNASWEIGDAPSGVYYYKLTAGDLSTTRKLVALR